MDDLSFFTYFHGFYKFTRGSKDNQTLNPIWYKGSISVSIWWGDFDCQAFKPTGGGINAAIEGKIRLFSFRKSNCTSNDKVSIW